MSFVAHDVKAGIGSSGPALDVLRPASQHDPDVVHRRIVRWLKVVGRHLIDGLIDTESQEVGEREDRIERIPDNVDCARGHGEIDGGVTVHRHQRVVRLAEEGALLHPCNDLADLRPHARHVLGRPLVDRTSVEHLEPHERAVALEDLARHLVDVERALAVVEEIVKERPHPGVARFRETGEPDNVAHGCAVTMEGGGREGRPLSTGPKSGVRNRW